MYIENQQDLRELFGQPKERTLLKQLKELEQHSINFIALSPFLTLATYNQEGKADCSPRGGKPGFVRVINSNTIIIPEAKGNKRLDSLLNILDSKGVGCLFFIPGVDETLRINGDARISKSNDYLKLFANEQNPPLACIEITIKEVYLHCAKALMRSELWAEGSKIKRNSFPTLNEMIKDQLNLSAPPESQEQMVARYQKDL